MNYEEMTNKELQALCDDLGIDVDSKNVSKPTKREYIIALERFNSKDQQDADEFLNVGEPDGKEKMQEEAGQKVKVKKTRAQKRREQQHVLFQLKRVIITSNQTNQTKTNGIERITWGNRLVGIQTDNVVLGKPWHVREGALRNLRAAIVRNSVQDDEGNQVRWETVPAYNIQELEPLTKEEIDKIAKRQTIRDASIESLV